MDTPRDERRLVVQSFFYFSVKVLFSFSFCLWARLSILVSQNDSQPTMKKRNSVWGLRKKQEIFFGEHYHFKLKKT
jgi:hypothetical protein